MAFAYARLKEIAYLPGSAAAQITNSSGKTFVRLIILHNTHTSALSVTLYNVPNGDSAGAANQFFKESIGADDTVMLEFPVPGLVLSDASDTIQGLCGTADKVTIQAYGGTE